MIRMLTLILLVTCLFSQDQEEVVSVFTGSFGSVSLNDQIYNRLFKYLKNILDQYSFYFQLLG